MTLLAADPHGTIEAGLGRRRLAPQVTRGTP
jgi:hypothetical protein